MGLFHRKKKEDSDSEKTNIFGKNKKADEKSSENVADDFDPDNITKNGPLIGDLSKIEFDVPEDHEGYIRKSCDNISQAKAAIESAKNEYSEVNSYLLDVQTIEEMPSEDKEDLTECAEHLLELKSDLDTLEKKKSDITGLQFRLIEKNEASVSRDLKQLKSEEKYLNTIKNDLRLLKGEHDKLIREEKDERERRRFLRNMSLIGGLIIIILFILYFVLYFMYEAEVMTPFILTAGGALLIAVYLLIESDRNKKNIKLVAAKINKTIGISNTVKIKYVNETNSVDFIRDRYGVNNSGELEYRLTQYNDMKENEERRKKTSITYDNNSARLSAILGAAGLHDPDIWIYQANAIVDHKDMVEIRHRLNTRRARIRTGIENNEKTIELETEKIHRFRDHFPDEKGMVADIMDDYHIVV